MWNLFDALWGASKLWYSWSKHHVCTHSWAVGWPPRPTWGRDEGGVPAAIKLLLQLMCTTEIRWQDLLYNGHVDWYESLIIHGCYSTLDWKHNHRNTEQTAEDLESSSRPCGLSSCTWAPWQKTSCSCIFICYWPAWYHWEGNQST